LPKLYSIHKGTVVSIQSFGCFVRLGDGSDYKDGLLHISRLSASGRVDKVEDMLSQDDKVHVKVVEVKDEEEKYSVDMRHVNQTSGEDQDPNNVNVHVGGGKGKGGKPEPIRIGAIQATTCTRCGATGHMAKECWGAAGKSYELLGEMPAENLKAPSDDVDKPPSGVVGHDAKTVKAALKAFLAKKEPGAASSDSSSPGKKKRKKEKKSKKKEKKVQKKERKKMKKSLKKEKKEQKKKIKELQSKLGGQKKKGEAAQDDKDAKEQLSDVKVGDKMVRKGKFCTVIKVDYSVDPPSVMVEMEEGKNTVGTELNLLKRAPAPVKEVKGKKEKENEKKEKTANGAKPEESGSDSDSSSSSSEEKEDRKAHKG